MRINGIKVKDAAKPLEIVVMPGDIAKGDSKNPSNCVMAVAIKRQLHVVDTRVHLSRIYVRTAPDEWVRYAAPQSMRSEIIAFDRGGKFVPGSHTLSAIKPSIKLGRKAKPTKKVQGTHPQRGHRIARRHNHTLAGIRPHGANR
jgi:hypothetical protein